MLRRVIAVLSFVLVLGTLTAPAAVSVPAQTARPSAVASAPCPNPSCYPGPRYQILDLKTFHQVTLWGLGEIGSCINDGGTCTIGKVASRTTQVGTSLGMSKGSVAASIDVSLSKTSSTSVSCTSPRLKRGQIYRAYVRGISKSYKIRKTYAGHTWTSGTLAAREPYKLSITCRVESR